MTSGPRTRILIVDDSAVMRSLVRTVVCSDSSLEVVGTAGDGESALNAMQNLKPDLVILDVATRQEVKRLAVGHGSGGIQMQPDGARAYVAFGPDGFVAVVDLKTLEVVGRVEVGGGPDGLAWAVR